MLDVKQVAEWTELTPLTVRRRFQTGEWPAELLHRSRRKGYRAHAPDLIDAMRRRGETILARMVEEHLRHLDETRQQPPRGV